MPNPITAPAPRIPRNAVRVRSVTATDGQGTRHRVALYKSSPDRRTPAWWVTETVDDGLAAQVTTWTFGGTDAARAAAEAYRGAETEMLAVEGRQVTDRWPVRV